MSILNDKEKVFGNISALRTLTDDFPQLKINNSFPSVNNSADPQQFLIDLILSLTGFEELRDTLVDILSYASETMEDVVKDTLKVQLKGITSCGVDGSLPLWLRSTGSGIEIQVKKIDFFEIFKVDPETQAGNLMYEDVSAQTGSTDFNTFLYYVIQDEGVEYSWQGILTFEFNQGSNVPYNTLTIKADPSYDSLTLTQLNNDFIDSITLFPSTQLITKLIDGLFGSVSFNVSVNKSESQLEMEEQINTVIDCITNADDDYVIDDTYFEFSNEQLQDIKEVATNRRNGIRQLKTCGDVDVDMPIEFLTAIKEQFDAIPAGDRFEQHEVIRTNLNSMANQVSSFAGDPVDEYAVQLDFMGLMFKSLIKAYVNAILGPKVISIFLLNYKITNGLNAEFTNPIDLLKQNKVLIQRIINIVRDKIITILLQLVLKYITKLIAANQVEALKEKANAQLAILLSLVGVPQDVIRLIRENSPITF